MINVEIVLPRSSNYAIKCIKVKRFPEVESFGNISRYNDKIFNERQRKAVITESSRFDRSLTYTRLFFAVSAIILDPLDYSTFTYVNDDIHDGISEGDPSNRRVGIPRGCDCWKNWKYRETAAAQVRGFQGTDIRYRIELSEGEMQGSSTKNHRARG